MTELFLSLLFINNFSVSLENQTDTLKTTFEGISAEHLELVIGLPVIDGETSNTEKVNYTGYYSYVIQNNNKVKHGNFKLEYQNGEKSAVDQINVKYNYNVTYTGTFNNGVLQGAFTEKALESDGVDIYNQWSTTLIMTNGVCSSAVFKGNLGHIMPKSTYKFENLELCTFRQVFELAEKKWEKEYTVNKSRY
ncbi:hypothetical protein [Roseivirga pacifica]|uniref:hypothetical protein n=1 Tax=Roseivirga pacifica TaxID=1267423 RepID=UPI003BAFD0DF